jgi:trehalose/maltose hydrolase-like predicted phosphorylase
VVAVTAWQLTYEGYDPAEEGLREALCTVGNGYLATRGAAPEADADDVHYPGTYAAGVFNRLTDAMSGRTVDNESIVNLPNWLPLTFRIEGGDWFHVDQVELLEHTQTLDLREAVLIRRLRFRDAQGRTTSLTQRRLASMHDHPICALETTLLAEDWSGRLEVRSALDGRVRNWLVPRYRKLASDHLSVVQTGSPADDTILVEVETTTSHVRVAMAARTTVHTNGGEVAHDRRLVEEHGWVAHHLDLTVTARDPISVEKVVAVFTSRDAAIESPAGQAARVVSRQPRFEELVAHHVIAWRHLWERFHFEVAGDEDAMRILRLHRLHVLQTLSPHTTEIDAGVPARGLHGEAYRGHIFWDEIFVLPLISLRLPEVARALLRYRYRRLDEARHAAAEAGFRGAMFPWQSGSDGREETQQLHLNPMSGRWNPDPTYRQRHVGIAVAYNVWEYHQATGDIAFLSQFGAEMLLEIARFWASIARYDKVRDRFVIEGVMGPDEFHSGYPGAEEAGLDNNAYTNVMAAWVLRRAQDALDLLPELTRRQLLEGLGIGPQELEHWRAVSRRMFVPFHDEGIISQFEGYGELDELDWDAYRAKYGDIARLDRILEAEGLSPNQFKLSKQADVLMLFYLLSADEVGELFGDLGYELTPEAITRTIDYYEARSSHGSTLSAIVHAWALARSHPERALEFYEQALVSDVADIQGGTTREGIHLAAMAGSVDLLQRCFSGLELRGERLVLDPAWPASLGTLTYSIQYRDVPLSISVAADRVAVAAGPGMPRPVEVECRGEVVVVVPGATAEFSLASVPDGSEGAG